jgi:hypothetical protein
MKAAITITRGLNQLSRTSNHILLVVLNLDFIGGRIFNIWTIALLFEFHKTASRLPTNRDKSIILGQIIEKMGLFPMS